MRALTGIDTDRLEEEKRRGISIDLGFAHLEHGGVRFGFVDVPGHERFVRNMLAGAGGIDIALLVIAADEGVKPQTREHFDICRLLGLRHGLVALTKCDLADAEMLELARLETAEFVAGSFLEGAPVVAVSSKTGAGLDELRAELVRIAQQAAERDAGGPFRLPVDRSFVLRGFGTVVTGTLISGVLRPEDEVELQPAGRRLRVRGVQVHGGGVAEARAGQRTAVNLAGIDAGEIRRGMSLVEPGLFHATQAADVEIEMLAAAPPLKHGAPVHFHSGTAEVEAEVRLFVPGKPLAPGSRSFARLLFREPLLILPGDRFILRRFSPLETVGGGAVIDCEPPLRMRKPLALERVRELAAAAPARRLALFCAETPEGATAADLARKCGARPGWVRSLLPQAGLVELGGRLLPARHVEELLGSLRTSVAEHHRAHPLSPGMPRSAAPVPGHLLEALLGLSKDVVADGEVLRLKSHRLTLQAEEDEALGRMESLFREAGLAVPAVGEVLARSGLDAARSRSLLQILLRQGRLVRVGADLIYHSEAIAGLKGLLSSRKGQRFTVPQFKEWTGVSRKYAIPLLEYLDRERVTRREGEQRVVL